jgi:hypothetical protein
MRKSRSSHVKCDCGEKTSKCAHLQPTVEGHTETCCCNHGGRCSCSHKKELHPTLDTVPESDSDGEALNKGNASRPKLVARRRRANTVHSDTLFSFDQSGNRTSSSKHRPSQKVGPYQLNRVNSANSTSSLGAGSDSMVEARRGVASQRRVKSEATSPLMSGTGFPIGNGTVPPLDLSAIDYPPYNVANGSFDLFGASFSPDHEGPMYSAGLSAASVDWSHYDLNEAKRNANFTPSSYSQTGIHGLGGFDFGSGSEQLPHLVNTTSTSGDVSEVEDFMSGADGEFNSGYMRQGNMMGNPADLTSIDYDSFYKGTDQNAMQGTGMSMVEEDPAFWMPNYHDGIMDESPDPLGPPTMGNFWEL